MTSRHKYHRRSIRLKGYDYSQEGLYFITICCQDKICRFGHIENKKMIHNQYSIIAHNEWIKTPQIRPNIILHEFIIMPNHMHGIIEIIYRGKSNSPLCTGELNSPQYTGELNSPKIEFPKIKTNVCDTPLQSPSQTIGAIVRGYKSAVTKQLNALGMHEKLWQRNYYEHIIHNEQSYIRISEYICDNPQKWANDKFSP
ncbi:MAG TPA: transposase [Bacteroidales bacterium]|jgi:REP element-mobilizing transposase RayT|nr:transposase [Bacteroidales bacterium]